jgi:hypothetical protein
MSEEVTDERLAAAHRALRAGGDIQFDLPPAPGPPQPPAWLKALGEWFQTLLSPIGRLFSWISSMMPDAPYARILLWTMIAVLALLVMWLVIDRVRGGAWRMPQWRRRRVVAPVTADGEPIDWSPEAAPAQRWLDQADRLADDGRFAEAVHHLLLRSVEDIGRRRPQFLRPALTSRDIAQLPGLPSAPRRVFADLAAVVERSLFGGAPVGADEWQQCRAAYAEFAMAKAWHA